MLLGRGLLKDPGVVGDGFRRGVAVRTMVRQRTAGCSLVRLGASGESHQYELIAEVIRLVVQMAWVGSAPRVLEIVRILRWSEGRGYELERLA